MGAVDPRDATAVAAAVRRWAADRFGGPVDLVGDPRSVGAGFDSHIHLVQLAGPTLSVRWRAPLVVRILPSAGRVDQAIDEALVQRWAAERGYPVPKVLTVLAPGDLLDLPVQIMERAAGTTMLDALKAAPWRARQLVDQLAALHLRLHAIGPRGWPGATAPEALPQARLGLARRAAAELDDRALADALERAQVLVTACSTTGQVVVCHGDFHPLNVMVDGAQACVIDWTDAGLGPREADVSRTALLFHLAALAADSRVERAVLSTVGPVLARRYLRTYRRGAHLDADQMRRWEALHALHGWAQVEMLHTGAFEVESSSSGAEDRVPRALVAELRRRFEAAAR